MILVRDEITPRVTLTSDAGQLPPPFGDCLNAKFLSLPLQTLLNVHAPFPLQQINYLQVPLQIAACLCQVRDAGLHGHLVACMNPWPCLWLQKPGY